MVLGGYRVATLHITPEVVTWVILNRHSPRVPMWWLSVPVYPASRPPDDWQIRVSKSWFSRPEMRWVGALRPWR